MQRDQRTRSLRLERKAHHRLQPPGRLGHPGVLDAPAALERQEAAVVRPVVPLEMHRVIEQPVDDRIDDCLLGAEPRAARLRRIEPAVEDVGRLGRHRAGECELRGANVVLGHSRPPALIAREFRRPDVLFNHLV